MDVLTIDDIPTAIRTVKQQLRQAMPNYKTVFQEIEADMRRRVQAIRAERDRGLPVIPEIHHRDIVSGQVAADVVTKVKERGACVIRQVFSEAQATAWDKSVAEYAARNNLEARLLHRARDDYFGKLASSKPQIFGVYWSEAQVEARQSPALTATRIFLNRLWEAYSEGRVHFDPDIAPVYADRLRRRPPQSASLGLSPHCDGGSVERWLDENYQRVYRHVFSGNWKRYAAFDAAYRPEAREIPSPAVCSMFRTFQGWTALTAQGPGDGTLQLVPIANAMMYILLRPLQDDVADDDLCGAQPGRALSVNVQWHSLLLEALTSIPLMQAGDAVFWHNDVIHAVEDRHQGEGFSNVMYIAALPGCEKNDRYLARQLAAFLRGDSPPDFAPDNFEVDFVGRATPRLLTPLGRTQMGMNTSPDSER